MFFLLLDKKTERSGIFAHGFAEVSYGSPWQGHSTNWSAAVHAQHAFYGYPTDAVSLDVVPTSWFDAPVQLFTSHNPGQGEQFLAARATQLLFTPTATAMESFESSRQRLQKQELNAGDRDLAVPSLGLAFLTNPATSMASPGLTGDCLTFDGFAATLPGYAGLGGSSADEPADRAIQVLDLIVDLIKFQDMPSICWREIPQNAHSV